MGIVTARDALKITLPRQEHPQINIANTFDNDIRGTHEDIQSVLVYVDKYETRKYSLRGRLISKTHVINAKAVGYDPLSAIKKLISILDGQLKSKKQ